MLKMVQSEAPRNVANMYKNFGEGVPEMSQRKATNCRQEVPEMLQKRCRECIKSFSDSSLGLVGNFIVKKKHEAAYFNVFATRADGACPARAEGERIGRADKDFARFAHSRALSRTVI